MKELPVNSNITDVTVYNDRALITRMAELPLREILVRYSVEFPAGTAITNYV